MLRSRGSEERLRQQFGGCREVDRDGSVYSSVGDRPIPPPKALRKIHADRQAEIQQRLEDEEADRTMAEYGMGVGVDLTAAHRGVRLGESGCGWVAMGEAGRSGASERQM